MCFCGGDGVVVWGQTWEAAALVDLRLLYVILSFSDVTAIKSNEGTEHLAVQQVAGEIKLLNQAAPLLLEELRRLLQERSLWPDTQITQSLNSSDSQPMTRSHSAALSVFHSKDHLHEV